MKRTLITLSLAAILGAWLGLSASAPAECSTDTECQRLCPVEDGACDGGPDPVVKPTNRREQMNDGMVVAIFKTLADARKAGFIYSGLVRFYRKPGWRWAAIV
jgi:hypothetical protein